MASTLRNPVEAARQVALVSLFDLLTSHSSVKEYNQAAPDDRQIASYTDSDVLASAWALIKAIFGSIRQVESVEVLTESSITEVFNVLSQSGYANMLRTAGETDERLLKIHPACALPAAVESNILLAFKAWESARDWLVKGSFEDVDHYDNYNTLVGKMGHFGSEINEIFDEIEDTGDGHSYFSSRQDEFGVLVFRDFLLEASRCEGGMEVFWDLNNPRMTSYPEVIVLLYRALMELMASPLTYGDLVQAIAAGNGDPERQHWAEYERLKNHVDQSVLEWDDVAVYAGLLKELIEQQSRIDMPPPPVPKRPSQAL